MKAILVIDIPEEYMGSNIDVKLYGKYQTIHERYVNKLRPLPQKKVGDDLYERYGSWTLNDEKEASYRVGYNDCLDEILGEEENNGLKPLPKDESHEYYGCPSCRHIVSSVQNYCENCGQKLDWRDIGETE